MLRLKKKKKTLKFYVYNCYWNREDNIYFFKCFSNLIDLKCKKKLIFLVRLPIYAKYINFGVQVYIHVKNLIVLFIIRLNGHKSTC